jgi:hypothetical protein
MSIELVRMPCASTLYIGIRTEAPVPIRWVQSSVNYLSASTSLLAAVLMLRLLLFS